jgi:hypothetical protein
MEIYLEVRGLTQQIVPKELQEFDDAFADIFQRMGALLIETRILTRFYRSIGARYFRSDDLNFPEEVRKAGIEFEKSVVISLHLRKRARI